MEKKDNKTLITILVAFIGIILIIVITTIVSINGDSKDNEYKKVISNMTSAAKICVSDGKCKAGNITLKELYDAKYIAKQKNPKTGKYFNENSYVNYSESSFYIK